MDLGDLNTIGDVTQSLKNLLAPPSLPDELDVTLDSPASLSDAAEGTFAKVNLYLYQVTENPYAKNQPWVTRTDGVQEYPPLALNLYYLVTPYASETLSAHRVLTHAMQKLYVNSTMQGDMLLDSLRLTVERLTINLCQMTLEELTRIWNSLQTPYRLSVSYEVRVVLIESHVERVPARIKVATHAYDQQ